MNEILVILIIVLIVSLGLSVISILGISVGRSNIERIALGFGVGIFTVFILMNALTFLGIGWSRPALLTPIIVLIVYTLKTRTIFEKIKVPQLSEFSKFEKLLLCLVFVTLIVVLLGSILRPLPSWDGWAAFFLQGKAGFVDGFFSAKTAHYAGISNPPLVAFAITFIFSLIGLVDDRSSLLLFSFFYLFLTIFFIKSATGFIGRKNALLFGFLFAATPHLIRHAGRIDVGHADIIVSYYFFCSAILLYDFLRTKTASRIILLEIFLASGALVKDEGLPFFIIVNIIILFKTKFKYLNFLILGVVPVISWMLFKLAANIPQNPFLHTFDMTRIPSILFQGLLECANFSRWQVAWSFILIIPFFIRKRESIFLLIFALQLSVYLLIYVTTSWPNPIDHMKGSFDRLLLHIYPLFFFYSTIVLGKNLRIKI